MKSPRDIRPTTALVRGAIFSMLESLVTKPWRVLDLYAGTGALGIEALSRGAEWVDFVEQNFRCCAVIRENLKATGAAGKAGVRCQSVAKALTLLQGHDRLAKKGSPKGRSPFGINLSPSPLQGEGDTGGEVFRQPHYNVVVLDPPYSDRSLASILQALAASSLVDRDSTIVVQHSSHSPLAADYGKFHLIKHRRYGETRLSIYQQE